MEYAAYGILHKTLRRVKRRQRMVREFLNQQVIHGARTQMVYAITAVAAGRVNSLLTLNVVVVITWVLPVV